MFDIVSVYGWPERKNISYSPTTKYLIYSKKHCQYCPKTLFKQLLLFFDVLSQFVIKKTPIIIFICSFKFALIHSIRQKTIHKNWIGYLLQLKRKKLSHLIHLELFVPCYYTFIWGEDYEKSQKDFGPVIFLLRTTNCFQHFFYYS